MTISDLFMYLAILIELVVAILAIVIAVRNKKIYGWFIALSFALFLVYDMIRIFGMRITSGPRELILLAAGGSMLYAVWLLFKEK